MARNEENQRRDQKSQGTSPNKSVQSEATGKDSDRDIASNSATSGGAAGTTGNEHGQRTGKVNVRE